MKNNKKNNRVGRRQVTAETKRKISEALKRAGRGARKAASKGVIKASGAIGYGIGRFGDRLPKLPEMRMVDNKSTRLQKKIIGGALDKTERGTRLKSSVAFIGGTAKGALKTEKNKYNKQKRD